MFCFDRHHQIAKFDRSCANFCPNLDYMRVRFLIFWLTVFSNFQVLLMLDDQIEYVVLLLRFLTNEFSDSQKVWRLEDVETVGSVETPPSS